MRSVLKMLLCITNFTVKWFKICIHVINKVYFNLTAVSDPKQ